MKKEGEEEGGDTVRRRSAQVAIYSKAPSILVIEYKEIDDDDV